MANFTLPDIKTITKKTKNKEYTYYTCTIKLGDYKNSLTSKHYAVVDTWRKRTMEDVLAVGESAKLLTPATKRDAIIALEKLPDDITLVDAVDFYLANHNGGISISCIEATNQYITTRYDEHLTGQIREATFREIQKKCDLFGHTFHEQLLADISGQVIIDWLFGRKLSPNSVNQYLSVYSVFFNWCVQEKYLRTNPLKEVKRPKKTTNNGKASILTIPQINELFNVCVVECEKMIPYFAIGIFAGIRPAELQRLKSESILLDEGIIRIEPEVSKTGQARVVTISENLKQILSDYKVMDRFVPYSRTGYSLLKGLISYILDKDIMRHTFASYHLAAGRDANATAYEMGHRDSSILFRHYRGLVTGDQAEDFWKITV